MLILLKRKLCTIGNFFTLPCWNYSLNANIRASTIPFANSQDHSEPDELHLAKGKLVITKLKLIDGQPGFTFPVNVLFHELRNWPVTGSRYAEISRDTLS